MTYSTVYSHLIRLAVHLVCVLQSGISEFLPNSGAPSCKNSQAERELPWFACWQYGFVHSASLANQLLETYKFSSVSTGHHSTIRQT